MVWSDGFAVCDRNESTTGGEPAGFVLRPMLESLGEDRHPAAVR
jgi:hypothetical protein